MKKYYDTIQEFKEYVDAYCKKHHISIDEALTHKLIKEVLQNILAIK